MLQQIKSESEKLNKLIELYEQMGDYPMPDKVIPNNGDFILLYNADTMESVTNEILGKFPLKQLYIDEYQHINTDGKGVTLSKNYYVDLDNKTFKAHVTIGKFKCVVLVRVKEVIADRLPNYTVLSWSGTTIKTLIWR